MSAEKLEHSRVCVGLHSAPVRDHSTKKWVHESRRWSYFHLAPHVRRAPDRGLAGFRCGGLCGVVARMKFEEPEKFAHLHTGDDDGGTNARKIVSAIDQQSALHGFRTNGAPSRRARRRPSAFARISRMKSNLAANLTRTFAKLRAPRAGCFRGALALDGFEEFERGAQQAERRKMLLVHAGKTREATGLPT